MEGKVLFPRNQLSYFSCSPVYLVYLTMFYRYFEFSFQNPHKLFSAMVNYGIAVSWEGPVLQAVESAVQLKTSGDVYGCSLHLFWLELPQSVLCLLSHVRWGSFGQNKWRSQHGLQLLHFMPPNFRLPRIKYNIVMANINCSQYLTNSFKSFTKPSKPFHYFNL